MRLAFALGACVILVVVQAGLSGLATPEDGGGSTARQAYSLVPLTAQRWVARAHPLLPQSAGSGQSENARPKNLPAPWATGTNGLLPKYMILLNDQFAANAKLAEFVDWKRRKGYSVRLVTSLQISRDGAPQATQITDFMRGLSGAEYPEYLLILGNSSVSNGVAGVFVQKSAYFQGGYSDYDYALRDTTDVYPDLCYGRLPASNNTELTVMLEKVLAADRNPPGAGSYQKVLVAATLQDNQPRDNREDTLFCETADAVASYFEQQPSGTHYDCVRAFTNPNLVNYRCFWNANSILWNPGDQIGTRITKSFLSSAIASQRVADTVNAGVNLVLHRDHGTPSGWVQPAFSADDVNRLTNGLQRPLVMSINCLTGDYVYENCFALSWLLHPDGGAYAVIESVDVSFSWCNDWLTHGFFTAICPDYVSWHNQSTAPRWSKALPVPGGAYGPPGSAPRLGQALNYAKMYMLEFNSYPPAVAENVETLRIFHLFGDPEAFVLLPELANLQVSFSEQIFTGPTNLLVSTGEPDCMVGLYGPAVGVHAVAYTDASGRTPISVSPTAGGDLYVTVTKFGRRPFEGVINVQFPGANPPSIERQPQSLVVEAGDSAGFQIVADGSPPLAYQWYLNGLPLRSGAGSNYAIRAASDADAGSYTVVVSNAMNFITSEVATLVVQTNTARNYAFAEAAPIRINNALVSAPYPADLRVAGVVGTLTNVSVTLSNLTCDHVGDLAALLVGPNGRGVVLFSGVGNGGGANSVILTFNDQAAAPPGQQMPLSSGAYQPCDWAHTSERTYPSPASPGPYATNLSAFVGSDPNGLWSLYLQDLNATSQGQVGGGWGLQLGVSPLGHTAPTVLQEPQNAVWFAGQTRVLEVRATGTAPWACQWWKDGQPLPGQQAPALTLSNLRMADSGSYSLTVSNLYGSATSGPATITVLGTIPLPIALDNTNLAWTTSTSAPWFGQTLDSHDLLAAARSGPIGPNDQSILQTTVIGPGIVAFWWKVSSEEGSDDLRLDIDGNVLAIISGEAEWESKRLIVTAGLHSLRWTYSKGGVVSLGSDAGWLGQVTYQPTLGAPDHLDWIVSTTNADVNAPLQTWLTARDVAGNAVTNFAGAGSIVGMGFGNAAVVLGSKQADETGDGGESGYTDGYDFTPSTDLLVTAVRSCYGTQASLWQEDGTVVMNQALEDARGTWAETKLSKPVVLRAGTRYILANFYSAENIDYYLTNAPPAFMDGNIGKGWYAEGEAMPSIAWPGCWPLIDLTYQPLVPVNISITPATVTFAAGTWSGSLAIGQPAEGLRLRVTDGNGHFGTSPPLSIGKPLASPLLSIRPGVPPILHIQGNVGAVIDLLNSGSLAGPWQTNAQITLANPSVELPLTNSPQRTRFFRLLRP